MFATACTMLIQEKTWAADAALDENNPLEANVFNPSLKRKRQTTLCFAPEGNLAINKRPRVSLGELRANSVKAHNKLKALLETVVDYQEGHRTLAAINNTLSLAITGQSAAETLKERAWHAKPKMGLKTWKKFPNGLFTLKDAGTAKNYLEAEELSELTKLTAAYVKFNQQRAQPLYLSGWKKDLESFLVTQGKNVSSEPSVVASKEAKVHVEKQYKLFKRPLRVGS